MAVEDVLRRVFVVEQPNEEQWWPPLKFDHDLPEPPKVRYEPPAWTATVACAWCVGVEGEHKWNCSRPDR